MIATSGCFVPFEADGSSRPRWRNMTSSRCMFCVGPKSRIFGWRELGEQLRTMMPWEQRVTTDLDFIRASSLFLSLRPVARSVAECLRGDTLIWWCWSAHARFRTHIPELPKKTTMKRLSRKSLLTGARSESQVLPILNQARKQTK